MMNILTGQEHIHADEGMGEEEVLAVATRQAQSVASQGKVLVDVKPLDHVCRCGMEPPGRGWMVLIYYVEEA